MACKIGPGLDHPSQNVISTHINCDICIHIHIINIYIYIYIHIHKYIYIYTYTYNQRIGLEKCRILDGSPAFCFSSFLAECDDFSHISSTAFMFPDSMRISFIIKHFAKKLHVKCQEVKGTWNTKKQNPKKYFLLTYFFTIISINN